MWMKFLSIMTVPCNCCLSLELSVSPILAHKLWTADWIYCIFISLSLRQTEQIARRLRPPFITIAKKLIISKLYPLFPWHRECFYLSAMSPSYYAWSYHSLSKRKQVQTYSTMYINCTNKPDNVLESAYEISATNFQRNSSNATRGTAENVHCFSGKVHWIIDPSTTNIQRISEIEPSAPAVSVILPHCGKIRPLNFLPFLLSHLGIDCWFADKYGWKVGVSTHRVFLDSFAT
jgi:hypothetical protein